MDEKIARSLKFMRYGLLVVVSTAFAAAASTFYVALAPLNALDTVITWTAIVTVATGLVSVVVYYAYKSYLGKRG